MYKDIFIVANPIAGTQNAPRIALDVLNYLRKNGANAELVLSQKPKDAIRIANQIENPQSAIVACGGDGTVQEIISGLKNSDTPIGIIPSGRCNDFARAIGFHNLRSPSQLAEILLSGKTKVFDCGEVNGKKFLTVATLGFDSEASRFVENHKLILKGTAAYLYAIIKVLLSYKPIEIKLKSDDDAFEGKILLCASANTPFYGGAMKIAPQALPDDGFLHICIVNNVSPITVIRMLMRVFKGTHITHPAVKTLKTKAVEIKTTGSTHWICADGESLTQTPVKISIIPKSIKIICP